jgi:hypothetical protein
VIVFKLVIIGYEMSVIVGSTNRPLLFTLGFIW